MQTTVDLPKAGRTLAELVQRVLQGDDIIIAEAGTPLVRLVPIVQPNQPRVAGLSEGAATISDDFDAPLPDAFWIGKDEAPI